MFGLAPAEPSIYVKSIPIIWIVAAVGALCLTAGLYWAARGRGLSRANAVEFIHGTRYLDGRPVVFPAPVVET